MGSIVIRKIDDATKSWLRRRAALAGRSVEAELRGLIAAERARDEAGEDAGDPPRLPGEGFGSYLVRLSRPGHDLEIERDRTPHDGIDL
jgi:plasmid stability protein